MNNEFDDYLDEEDEYLDEDYEEIDAFIEYLESHPKAEFSILNLNKLQAMRFCAGMMKKLLREAEIEDADLTCGQSEFNHSIGFVQVEGVSISIKDMEGYSRAAEFASNVEIYPLKANKIRMTFTFHGLTKPIR